MQCVVVVVVVCFTLQTPASLVSLCLVAAACNQPPANSTAVLVASSAHCNPQSPQQTESAGHQEGSQDQSYCSPVACQSLNKHLTTGREPESDSEGDTPGCEEPTVKEFDRPVYSHGCADLYVDGKPVKNDVRSRSLIRRDSSGNIIVNPGVKHDQEMKRTLVGNQGNNGFPRIISVKATTLNETPRKVHTGNVINNKELEYTRECCFENIDDSQQTEADGSTNLTHFLLDKIEKGPLWVNYMNRTEKMLDSLSPVKFDLADSCKSISMDSRQSGRYTPVTRCDKSQSNQVDGIWPPDSTIAPKQREYLVKQRHSLHSYLNLGNQELKHFQLNGDRTSLLSEAITSEALSADCVPTGSDCSTDSSDMEEYLMARDPVWSNRMESLDRDRIIYVDMYGRSYHKSVIDERTFNTLKLSDKIKKLAVNAFYKLPSVELTKKSSRTCKDLHGNVLDPVPVSYSDGCLERSWDRQVRNGIDLNKSLTEVLIRASNNNIPEPHKRNLREDLDSSLACDVDYFTTQLTPSTFLTNSGDGNTDIDPDLEQIQDDIFDLQDQYLVPSLPAAHRAVVPGSTSTQNGYRFEPEPVRHPAWTQAVVVIPASSVGRSVIAPHTSQGVCLVTEPTDAPVEGTAVATGQQQTAPGQLPSLNWSVVSTAGQKSNNTGQQQTAPGQLPSHSWSVVSTAGQENNTGQQQIASGQLPSLTWSVVSTDGQQGQESNS